MEKLTKKILIGVIILLVVYFGYELYLKLNAEQPGYYDFENGNIQEQIQGDTKIITEEGLGLTMRVPSDWKQEIVYMGLILSDPYINVENPLRYFREWTQGCSIGISVENDEKFENFSSFDQKIQEMEYIKNGDEEYCWNDYCEILKIKGQDSLKDVFVLEDSDLQISISDVTITFFDANKRRIYRVNSLLSTQVPECENYLNDFINNLEFK